jgi:hypothetical protein
MTCALRHNHHCPKLNRKPFAFVTDPKPTKEITLKKARNETKKVHQPVINIYKHGYK